MPISSRSNLLTFQGRGLGSAFPYLTYVPASGTSGNAAAGFFTISLGFNNIGTTAPGTLVGLQLPPGLPNALFNAWGIFSNSTSSDPGMLVRIYQIGTLNLAATGNQFTHDSATFPVTRTQFGVATQPVSLIPMVYITTATATTAPVFRLRNVAGTNGYTNQDGTSVVGTRTMTMPSATTAAQSGFIIRLEEDDSGLQDITNIEVTTAGSAGAATIFGIEIIATFPQLALDVSNVHDSVFGALSMIDMAPAAPTSGTLTTYLVILNPTTSLTQTRLYIAGVLNGT